VLKKIRVIVSLVFFIPLLYLFIDFRNNTPLSSINSLLYLQFIPSLVKFLALPALLSAGFILVLILTLLFGRIYCSSVCPLGILQDVISNVSRRYKKNNKKKKFKFSEANNKLRYSLLFITTAGFISGSMFLTYLLDPYSNFGRITSTLLRPLYIGTNNLTSLLLEQFHNFSLYPAEFKGIDFITFIFPLSFLLLMIWMSFTRGRLFCNTICPVGTLLGLISRYSFFKIRINEELCTNCKSCEKACKAECIDIPSHKIDSSRCINCFNCIGSCPSFGVNYSFPGKTRVTGISETKRDFIKNTFFYFTGLSLSQVKVQPKKASRIPVIKKHPVTPPGSLSIENFNDHCTACHLCVTACPSQVLQPSFLEYGFTGILQPRMDYNKSFCNFNCILCSEICPTSAIQKLTIEEKKVIQPGKVNFIIDNCIVKTEETECGACSEHCPTKAVKMISYKHLRIPEIDQKICVGCGACEYACPVKPYKAIYVEGNILHQKAQKPIIKKIEEVNSEEDFPF